MRSMQMANLFIRLLIVSFAMMGGALCASSAPVVDSGLPNISARPQDQVSNVDVFADAIYWYTAETADWAVVHAPNGNTEKVAFKTIGFDWNPGFRVGVGYNMDHDRWDTQFYYTWFQARTTEHARGAADTVQPAFIGWKVTDTGYFDKGELKWNLRFDMFDWDLARNFFVSKALSVRPLIGLKGGWIKQSIHTEWKKRVTVLGVSVPLTAVENLKNNFWGVGPKGGVNTKWIFGKTQTAFFSLFGDFAAAFMWGHWTIKDKFQDTLLTTLLNKSGRNRDFGAVMVQGFMGLGFDLNFDKDRSHFAMKLGYEVQDWFNQFQIFTNATGTQANELVFQGLTFDARLDF